MEETETGETGEPERVLGSGTRNGIGRGFLRCRLSSAAFLAVATERYGSHLLPSLARSLSLCGT